VRVILTVSNDLASDQRVRKMCLTLVQKGYEVFVIGRRLAHSADYNPGSYAAHRMKLMFNRGPLFYAELNIRFFIFLLFKKADVIHANDLDTLLPAWLVATIRRKKLVYDTHEYFTGVPELQNRPFTRKVWKSIERFILPRLPYVITVNDSIARLYEKEYGLSKIHVIRNIPVAQTEIIPASPAMLGRLPENTFRLIIQGNGINMDRGAEEAVEAMQWLNDCCLIIAGSGDVLPLLHRKVEALQLQKRVIFFEKMPYAQLMGLTAMCHLGLSLDKDTNINYKLSLPNKLFDYLRAGIPVLSSNLPELRNIIESYNVGWLLEEVAPRVLADKIQFIVSDLSGYKSVKSTISEAAKQLCWENEVLSLKHIYKDIP
jgi:glycosyltransferase involved in cell wall biosynthesis